MKTKKIISLAILLLATAFGFNTAIIQPSYADDNLEICKNLNIPEEIRAASGCPTSTKIATPEKAIGTIVTAIIGVLGIVAVVFVIMGGVQYMTSAGDPGKIKKAKDTILYACIGLAVCALAFAITQFAINAINQATTTPPAESEPS